jgi:pimeloyl-ACP methyl ester carboxylesterase
MTVRDCRIDIIDRGSGRPILFLHPGIGLDGSQPLIDRLSGHARVIAPAHPGFENSELPRSFSSVDDLAYFYLDLIDDLDLDNVLLVGASFGGWIAAAMAIKSCERLAGLVLAGAVGIKIGSRDSRDIADIYALADDEIARRSFAAPDRFAQNYKQMPHQRLVTIARNREALTLFAWSPYMHDPKLHGRLHRIAAPTLVLWGEADGIVTPDYGRTFAEAIPGARFELIADAGHYPHIEQPDAFARHVLDFTNGAEPVRQRAAAGA